MITETELIQELLNALQMNPPPESRCAKAAFDKYIKDVIQKAQSYLDSVKFQQQSEEQKQAFLKERMQIAEQTWNDAEHPDNIDGVYAWVMGDNRWQRQFTRGGIFQYGWFFVEFKPNSNIVTRFGHEMGKS